MNSSAISTRRAAFICAALFAFVAAPLPVLANDASVQTEKAFEPKVGQDGKDVVWVPTAQVLVDKMLDMAGVTPDDFVIDLGSGDGRTVITAAKRGVRAHGIEYDSRMVELSKRNAEQAGVSDRATFEQADIFQTDFSKASVLTLFLLPDLNVKLRPAILKMKPGTRVVANSFGMSDWHADATESVGEDCTSYCRAYLWIVPADAAGTWSLPQGKLTLQQKYQVVSGALETGAKSLDVIDGRLRGEEITFNAGGMRFSGRIKGDVIEGVMKSGEREETFQARRAN